MTTIRDLSQTDSASSGDLLVLFSQMVGDTRSIALSNLAEALQTMLSVNDDKVTQYATPASGANIAFANGGESTWLVVTPAATIASATITFPAVGDAVDRQEVLVNTTQTITSLTWAANGASAVGFPTTLAANGFVRGRFEGVTKTWYRVG